MKLTDKTNDYRMLSGVNENLVFLFKNARETWPGENLDFRITCGLRTNEQQEALYRAGRSKIRKDGPHVMGMAVDIVMILHGKVNWERIYYVQFWGFIESYFKSMQDQGYIDYKYRLTWGGDWNHNGKILESDNWEVDLTHYQLDLK